MSSAVPQDDGSYEIQLDNPIHVGSSVVDVLRLRPLRSRHLDDIPMDSAQMRFGHMMTVAGRLAGQPPNVMGELQGSDMVEVMRIVGLFFQGFLPTGESSSPPSPTDSTGDRPSSASSRPPRSRPGPSPRRL